MEYIKVCSSYFNNDIYVRGRGLFIVSELADELKIKENYVEAKLLVKPN